MSCLGRCGYRGNIWLLHTLDTCACDALCQIYQDCCYDYNTVCATSHPETPITTQQCVLVDNVWLGDKVSSSFFLNKTIPAYKPAGILLVTKCPAYSDENKTRLQCEQPEQQPSDLKGLIPVSGLMGGQIVDFQNKYCAECNLNHTFWKSWKSEYKCKNTFAFREQLRSMTHKEKLDFLSKNPDCKLYVESPFKTKPCQTKDIISTCNPSLSSVIPNFSHLVTACESYSGIIPYTVPKCRGMLFYKNSHCALCNGLKLDDLKCSYGDLDYSAPLWIPSSFSLLLDFSMSDVQLLRPNAVPFSRATCLPNEILKDGVCVPKVCSDGYIQYNDHCYLLVHENQTFQTLLIEGVIQAAAVYDTLDYNVESCVRDIVQGVFLEFLSLPTDIPIVTELERFEFSASKFKFRMSVQPPKGLHVILDMMNSSLRIENSGNVTVNYNLFTYRLFYFSIQNFSPNDSICNIYELQNFTVNDITVVYSSEYNMQLVFLKEISVFHRPENLLISAITNNPDGPSPNVKVSLCNHIPEQQGCTTIPLESTEYNELNNSIKILRSGNIISSRKYMKEGDMIYICKEYIQDYINSYKILTTADYIKGILTMVGGSISILALAITMFTYCTFRSLRNVPGKNLMNLVGCLFFGQLIQLFGMDKNSNKEICTAIAAFMHFIWLSCFSWMSVIAFHGWNTFRKKVAPKREVERYLRRYCVVAYIVPFCIVSACLALHFAVKQDVYSANGLCWISQLLAFQVAFLIPISLSLSCNILCFVGIVVVINKASHQSKLAKNRKNDLCKSLIYVKLSTLMGFSWIFGYMAVLTEIDEFWFPFIVFSSLQGFLVSVAFTCNKHVLHLYYERIRSLTKEGICKGKSEETIETQPNNQNTTQTKATN